MVTVNLYSENKDDLEHFLSSFYNSSFNINKSNWKHEYRNPIEIAEIIGAFIDNSETFNLIMWISLDKDVYINITEKNAESILKYLFERFPY